MFLDNDTRMLFATAYDGDWDAYIDDFATKIPDFLHIIDSAWEGWPGIRSPQAKHYLAKYQVMASSTRAHFEKPMSPWYAVARSAAAMASRGRPRPLPSTEFAHSAAVIPYPSPRWVRHDRADQRGRAGLVTAERSQAQLTPRPRGVASGASTVRLLVGRRARIGGGQRLPQLRHGPHPWCCHLGWPARRQIPVTLEDGLVWAALHQDAIVVQLPDRSGPLAAAAAALLRRGAAS